jgi:hypothetical protein
LEIKSEGSSFIEEEEEEVIERWQIKRRRARSG